ncbi:hypothetical protein Ahy_A03g016964 isoform A [Arachis hypogaea]|uniref:Uncharacterized protein n=1 Tax=Arachis hypogaea TaxID=3818 RepID=A0A445E4X0_ARAHY|nr:hypothetical protein Ahy_A03g016964 isoform A [Arachis hypogaea]
MLASDWMIRVNNELRTHCPSVQNDILKRLYHTEDAPQDMMEMRAEIVAMLKSLSLHPYVQELKANKEELRVEKLKDKGRLEKALVEEEGKGKGLRCFGGITAVFSNFGSGCGSLGNVKADEKCKTKAIGVEGIGFYTHQIKECKENFINEVHQNLKVILVSDCKSFGLHFMVRDGPRLMDAFTQGALQVGPVGGFEF